MPLQAIFIIVLALLCIGMAVTLPRFGLSDLYSFWREAPETARTWLRLLFFPDLRRRISYADQLQVKVVLRTLHARHWSSGGSESVRIARVDVPVGCVALLRFPTQEGRCVLDTSSFVTFGDLDQTDIPVWLVQKSVRWQALVKTMLPTIDTEADAAGVRFHVAVHTTLRDFDDIEQLKNLGAECESYIEAVTTWVQDTLRDLLATRKYMEVTRQPDSLLQELNSRWEIEERKYIPQLAGFLTTNFTGIVPKLLHYQEDGRFSDYLRLVDQMDQRHQEIFRQQAMMLQDLTQRYEKSVGDLRARFEQITGLSLEADRAAVSKVPGAGGSANVVPALSKVVHDRIEHSIQIVANRHFQKNVETLSESYRGIRDTLDESTGNLINAANQLAGFVIYLKRQIHENSLLEQEASAEKKTGEEETSK